MKTLLLGGILALVLGAGLVELLHLAHPQKQVLPAAMAASLVSLDSFAVEDQVSSLGFSKRLTLTLTNTSDKDVYALSFGLLNVRPDQSEVRFITKGEGKLVAHSRKTFERIFEQSPGKKLNPHIRTVLYDDDSFDGDKETATRIMTERTVMREILSQFGSRILALDTSHTPLPDAETLAKEAMLRTWRFRKPDNPQLISSAYEGQDIRSQTEMRMYSSLIGDLYSIEMLFTREKIPARGYGKKLFDEMSSRY